MKKEINLRNGETTNTALWDSFESIKTAVREDAINFINKALDKYDGIIAFDMEETECAPLCYDGGNDSRLSTMFSNLLAIHRDGDKILLDLEDEKDYSIERVWAIEDLGGIISAILEYDEMMEDYEIV